MWALSWEVIRIRSVTPTCPQSSLMWTGSQQIPAQYILVFWTCHSRSLKNASLPSRSPVCLRNGHSASTWILQMMRVSFSPMAALSIVRYFQLFMKFFPNFEPKSVPIQPVFTIPQNLWGIPRRHTTCYLSSVLGPSKNRGRFSVFPLSFFPSRIVVFKFEHWSESPGGLVKTDCWVPPSAFQTQ